MIGWKWSVVMDTFGTTPGSSTSTSNEETWYCLTLDCSHEGYINVELKLQYPDDYHAVYCRPCREDRKHDPYARPPTAWRYVTSVREVDNGIMPDVLGWTNVLLPRDVCRLQPSVPKHRVRPFPYVKGLR